MVQYYEVLNRMISIIIVNWNSGELLGRCIRSLLEHAGDSEIIVVDNASQDSSLDLARSEDSAITIMANNENVGFAAASNAGWRASQGENVLFLNPDTECSEGAVHRLQEVLKQDEGIWAVGGLLVGLDGRPQRGFNVRSFPTLGNAAAELLLLDEIWPSHPWAQSQLLQTPDYLTGQVVQVDQPAAACLMLRRSALESTGGFDECFRPAWFEDVDLCKRIRQKGGKIFLEPAARFLHHGGASLRHLKLEEFLEAFHSNQIRYFAKHHGKTAARRIRLLVITGMYLRGVISLLNPAASDKPRLASARAYWTVARHFVAGPAISP